MTKPEIVFHTVCDPSTNEGTLRVSIDGDMADAKQIDAIARTLNLPILNDDVVTVYENEINR